MSRLADKLARGEFVVTAEIPSINTDRALLERSVELYRFADAINATDNPAAHAHASPLAVALGIRQCGMEPIMQLVCRDRNRLALQAELAGAALHGIENICCLTGDDVTAGDEPEARRVFDLDSTQLIKTARTIGAGRYLSGRTFAPAPDFCIGAVENPAAPPRAYRIRRAAKKALAGARFLQLQISFEHDVLAGFMAGAVEAGVARRVALIPSICIARSAKALRFVDERVPGVSVPAATIADVESSHDQGAACEELAVELAARALELPGVAGLHLISFGRDGAAMRLCERLGIGTAHGKDTVGHDSPVAL